MFIMLIKIFKIFIIFIEPAPVYTFLRPLESTTNGFTKHETSMECTVSSSMAIVGWYKEKTKLADGDKYSISKDMSGICRLTIKNCELNDSGKYYCRIEKQDEKTSSTLKVVGT